jgi:hypothetical protein
MNEKGNEILLFGTIELRAEFDARPKTLKD